jgi:hypothetical protein
MDLRNDYLFFIGMIILVTLFCAIAHDDAAEIKTMWITELLPEQINSWAVEEEDSIYTRNTIFEYMNGAGEIYLGYDFQRLLVRNYTKESAPPIAAEIYQMASSEDAYGIFTHDMDGIQVNLGQGAIYSMGLLRFWKGCIFVRLMAERETEETKAAIIALGRKISDAIQQEGGKPLLVNALPVEGLIKESIHYFHKHVSLNIHFYLADSDILNLSEKTEAVLGRYHWVDQKVRLLIIRYQKPEKAQMAYEQFVKVYFSDKPNTKSPIRVEKVEGDEFVGARWTDRFVILVFEARNKETCKQLTQSVTQSLKELFR